MAMGRRKPLSPKTRFEIFKRDLFTCQYCGGQPPVVILVVDHVIPVAKDGDNDPLNLITSCRDCNSGKSDGDLRQVMPSLHEQMEEKRVRAEQITAYNRFLMENRDREQRTVDELGRYWFDKTAAPEYRGKYVFGDAWARSVRTFLEHMAPAEIMDAMDIAHGRFPFSIDSKVWKYFCGVCWRKIKRAQGDG
jgi:hypothetical protein